MTCVADADAIVIIVHCDRNGDSDGEGQVANEKNTDRRENIVEF